MTRSAKTAIIIAAVLLIFGTVIGGIALLAGGRLNRIETKPVAHNIDSEFTKISCSLSFSDITLLPSESEKTYAVAMESDEITYSIKTENQTLYIEEVDNRRWYDNIGFFFGSYSVSLYLPEKHYESLACELSSGNMLIADHGFSFGEASVTTSSGSVSLALSDVGKTALHTASGSVALSAKTIGDLSVASASGSASVSADTAASVNGSSSSGNIVLNIKEVGSVSLDTSSGEILLKNCVAAGKIKIDTSSGSVKLVSSDAGELDLHTSSGDIRASLLTDKLYDTSSSSGDISVPPSVKDKGLCRIKTSSGNIRVTVGE